MMRQNLVKKRKHGGKKVCQRHQEKVISYDSNCKIKGAHWACISYSDPQTNSWFLDLFVVIKKLMCFSREIAGQVKIPYFKHWCIVYTISNKVFRIDGGGLAQVRSHQNKKVTRRKNSQTLIREHLLVITRELLVFPLASFL